MSDSEKKKYGGIALGLCLGGLFLAILIILVTKLLSSDSTFLIAPVVFFIFIGLQLAAFVLGIMSRKEALGKAAYITSAIFLIAGVLFLLHSSITVVEKTIS